MHALLDGSKPRAGKGSGLLNKRGIPAHTANNAPARSIRGPSASTRAVLLQKASATRIVHGYHKVELNTHCLPRKDVFPGLLCVPAFWEFVFEVFVGVADHEIAAT